MLKRASAVGSNHTIIQDEQIYQLGAGSRREEYESQTLQDTTRKFGLNIIFCSPTTRDHSTAHFVFEIICRNNKKRLSKVAIRTSEGLYLGYFIIQVLPETNKLWKEYNTRKDEFIETILSRSTQRLSLDDMSDALRDHPQFKFARTNAQRKVVATKMYPTLATNEITLIVENLALMDAMNNSA